MREAEEEKKAGEKFLPLFPYSSLTYTSRTKYTSSRVYSHASEAVVCGGEGRSRITTGKRGEWARGYKIAQNKHTHKYMMIIIVYALSGSAAAAPQNSANCCSSLLYNLPSAVSSSLSVCRPATLIPLSWRHCFKFHREREKTFFFLFYLRRTLRLSKMSHKQNYEHETIFGSSASSSFYTTGRNALVHRPKLRERS